MRKTFHKLVLSCLLLAMLVQWQPAWAEVAADEKAIYAACVKMVYEKPGEALQYANLWLAKYPEHYNALHCKALALYGGGDFTEAAELLEKFAGLSVIPTTARVDAYKQAAQSWQAANLSLRSASALGKAVAILADSGMDAASLDILMQQAEILENAGRPINALQALDHALEIKPDFAEAEGARTRIYKKLYSQERAKQIKPPAPTPAEAAELLSTQND